MNLAQQFDRITELWSPKVIGRINDQYVKIARIRGTFTWHKHDLEDEMFFVVKGAMRIEMQEQTVDLRAGDFHIVPRGVMHNPSADEECWVMLVEPVSTLHTGDVQSPLTKSIEEQLS